MAPKAFTADSEEQHQGRLIGSLARGLRILDILAGEGSDLRMTDIARRLSASPSTVSSLLATLKHFGYVEQDPSTKKYSLGPRLHQLALTQVSTSNLVRVAMPMLEKLAQETGETSALAKLSSYRIICLAEAEGSHSLSLRRGVGRPVEGHSTAIGKALLAHLTTAQLGFYLGQNPLRPATPNTITDEAALQEELARVRRAGYAVDDEESSMGVRCIGAPVFDFRHELVAAVSIGGLAERLPSDNIPDIARIVVGAAHDLSSRLGYVGKPLG